MNEARGGTMFRVDALTLMELGAGLIRRQA
jgi:hypothetical protein